MEGGGGVKLGRMIDVELASCITNSPLLHRQRKTEREGESDTERETEREKEREDEERSSIQLIKVEDSGISLRRRFLSSTPPSPCLFPFSLFFFFLPPPVRSLHILRGRWPGREH